MRPNDLPNPRYVDPNPYTGEADDEGVDYAKIQREKVAKAMASLPKDAGPDDIAKAAIRALA
jgi:hypothetical protein